MLHKRKIGRLRKTLRLESLEDRTLLSGNVTAFQDPFGTGRLFILGDNGNNAYTINQTNNLGFPTLTVAASSFANPVVPGNVTALNFIPGGTLNVPLASVSEIDITEGNGTNTILLGNTAGFSLLGNINISVGTGVDTVSLNNISTNAGLIQFSGTGGSTDKVSETNVIAGKSSIVTGNGSSSVTQTNVAFGFDTIVTGAGNDSVTITNSRVPQPPRSYAIGMLSVTTNGGNDSININNISVGPATLTSGAGNNTIVFDNSTIQQASITTGLETAGSQGSNKLDVSNDVITGKFLNVSALNQSGVRGVLIGGGAGVAGDLKGSINTVTMNNVQFSGGGDLNLRVDDGIRYFNRNGNGELDSASTVLMQLVDTSGNINVTLGDFFQSVMLGVGTVGLNDLDSKNLTVSIGNFNDIVVITAIEQASEKVTIGNVATYPIGPLPPPSVLINGIVGAGSGGGNLTINLGTNANGNLVGWPINVSESVNGNMSITGGDGLALNVTSTTVSGTLTITLGSGGKNRFESINLGMVTANDVSITVTSNTADVPDTALAGVFINLTNVNVLDTTPNLNNLSIIDNGFGADIVSLMNVNVVYGLDILLSGWMDTMAPLMGQGLNVLSAQNVTAAFGMIDGGGPAGMAGSVYQDLGGNVGYFVFNFVGH